MKTFTNLRARRTRPTEADVALARLSRTDSPGSDGFARRRFLQGTLATGGATGLSLSTGVFDGIAAAATPQYHGA